MANPPPVHTIKIGTIRAAVWSRPGEHGPLFDVTVTRLFKDALGQWQDSPSFGRDDLLVVAKVCDLAHTWVIENSTRDRHWEPTE